VTWYTCVRLYIYLVNLRCLTSWGFLKVLYFMRNNYNCVVDTIWQYKYYFVKWYTCVFHAVFKSFAISVVFKFYNIIFIFLCVIIFSCNFYSPAATVTIALTSFQKKTIALTLFLYVSDISMDIHVGGTYSWFVISIGQFSSMPSNLSMTCGSILWGKSSLKEPNKSPTSNWIHGSIYAISS